MINPTEIERTVLIAHRTRVALAKNFQEFQEAQLDLLDFMIAVREEEQVFQASEEIRKRALEDFTAKYDEWCTK